MIEPRAESSSLARAGRAALPFIAILAVVTLGIAAGTFLRQPTGVGNAPTSADPSATLAIASSTASSSLVPSSPTPMAAPAPPIDADWTRIDLPEPEPAVYGGALPQDVVAFAGGYVAAGTINRACCADGDPTLNSGAVWLSRDGHDWEVLEPDAMAHATLRQLVTDGNRLYAFGEVAEAADANFHYRFAPAGWTSIDGRTWTPMTGLPTVDGASATFGVTFVVALEPDGFAAAVNESRESGDVVSFWATDGTGMAWGRRGGPFNGRVDDLAGSIAVGQRDGEPRGDGSGTTEAVVWHRAADGIWTDGEAVTGASSLGSVVSGTFGYLATASFETVDPDGTVHKTPAVLASPDGADWSRRDLVAAKDETLSSIFAIGGVFVAVGDTAIDGNANAMAFVSTDGTAWARITDAGAFNGINNTILGATGTPSGLLAVGGRWDHDALRAMPVIWLAAP